MGMSIPIRYDCRYYRVISFALTSGDVGDVGDPGLLFPPKEPLEPKKPEPFFGLM